MDRCDDKDRATTGATDPAIVEYLNDKRTRDVVQFLIAHLAVNRPSDRVAFLADLFDRAVRSRGDVAKTAELDDSLSVFQLKHVEAMFDAMDPFRKRAITFVQYHNGMGTMGLVDYNRDPPVDGDGNVSRDTFVREA